MTTGGYTLRIGEGERASFTMAIEVVAKPGFTPRIDIARDHRDGYHAALRVHYDAFERLAEACCASREGRLYEAEVALRDAGRSMRFVVAASGDLQIGLLREDRAPYGGVSTVRRNEIEWLREAMCIATSPEARQ